MNWNRDIKSNENRDLAIFSTVLLFLLSIFTFASPHAEAKKTSYSHTLTGRAEVDEPSIHLWQSESRASKLNVWLLSGPTDNWHSDAAWFARLGPQLARNGYPAMSIDRPGIFAGKRAFTPGYCAFGKALAKISKQHSEPFAIIAFASANLAVRCMLAEADVIKPRFIIMLDPDALTDFTISRYSADAKPYKDNLAEYLEYIAAGKNNDRAKKKNNAEMAHLRELAKGDGVVDWSLADKLFANRMLAATQANLVKDIAIYDSDLLQASKLPLPKEIPLVIIDSAFESAYIDKETDEQEKTALIRWQKESSEWFKQQIRQQKCGFYQPIKSREHLLPFSKPFRIISWVQQLDSHLRCGS